ncbi:MAG TPA: type I-B CRISPR-associated protein Cas7/Csh2 [Vicinamibacterales bacterium]|nr:type I-B CRISPR-associated protein Cas7/Csh2 [Vicinamibacterales bacterium]
MSTDVISTRTEILFVYDVTDANPNGDPNDENRPRMDVEAGRAKVTDVRLKRTVRDYLRDYRGETIFVDQIEKDDGSIQEGKDRAEDFFKQKAETVLKKRQLIEDAVIKQCIDVRLFGATIPVAKVKSSEKDSSVTLTGAVQFAMGGTLHKVEPRFIKGTGAFASGPGAQQRTFREEYVLPYGLIAFWGIVNQQAAKTTKLTNADAEKLYEAIWYGTKNLITRSKVGQRPLLMVLVEYKTEHANAYIGRLDRFLSLQPASDANGAVQDEQIRGPEQITLDLSNLKQALAIRNDKVARLRVAWDHRLRLSEEPIKSDEGWTFLGLPAENLEYE